MFQHITGNKTFVCLTINNCLKKTKKCLLSGEPKHRFLCNCCLSHIFAVYGVPGKKTTVFPAASRGFTRLLWRDLMNRGERSALS